MLFPIDSESLSRPLLSLSLPSTLSLPLLLSVSNFGSQAVRAAIKSENGNSTRIRLRRRRATDVAITPGIGRSLASEPSESSPRWGISRASATNACAVAEGEIDDDSSDFEPNNRSGDFCASEASAGDSEESARNKSGDAAACGGEEVEDANAGDVAGAGRNEGERPTFERIRPADRRRNPVCALKSPVDGEDETAAATRAIRSGTRLARRPTSGSGDGESSKCGSYKRAFS